jgi:hypothetical protein
MKGENMNKESWTIHTVLFVVVLLIMSTVTQAVFAAKGEWCATKIWEVNWQAGDNCYKSLTYQARCDEADEPELECQEDQSGNHGEGTHEVWTYYNCTGPGRDPVFTEVNHLCSP